MMNQVPLTDADLHAYLDGELPATRRAEIEAYLADHADAAERVNAYREQKLALKALFDPVLTEPLPESLRRQAEAARPAMRQTSVLSRWSLQRMAASVAIAVVGGALGWGDRKSVV